MKQKITSIHYKHDEQKIVLTLKKKYSRLGIGPVSLARLLLKSYKWG